jgi:adenylate cyclase
MQGELLPNGRREISVLFCDVTGFAELSAKLGDHATAELLQRFFNIVGQLVEDYGGVVDKLMGDCVMATFNAVRSRADHKRAAREAARRIVRAVKEIEIDGDTLNVLVSVESGEAEVVTFNCGSHSATTVIGELINRAAVGLRRVPNHNGG